MFCLVRYKNEKNRIEDCVETIINKKPKTSQTYLYRTSRCCKMIMNKRESEEKTLKINSNKNVFSENSKK